MWKEKRKRKKNAKFSGHYVRPRMHNVCAHALRLHQLLSKTLPDNNLFLIRVIFIGLKYHFQPKIKR